MRADIERKLTDTWYGDSPPAHWLRSLVPLYRGASHLDKWWKNRNRCSDLESACIIVVGNITAGGSGKTPLVIQLCRILKQAGLTPGVISRGYGRKKRGLRFVSPASSPGEVGDEPLLIARRAGVPVVVSSDRCQAARALLEQQIDVIISDDGLQHHRMPRSLEICVVDGSRGFGNGSLIPAGPLREPLDRLSSVDHIITNGDCESLPEGIRSEKMMLVAGMLRSLNDGQGWRLAQFKGCSVHAVAGIGNPERFFRLLEQSGLKVIEHAFPDHHAFTEQDFAQMKSDFPVLMTEKDAVKCTGLGLKNAWFLSVEAVLPAAWEAMLVRQVLERLKSPASSS